MCLKHRIRQILCENIQISCYISFTKRKTIFHIFMHGILKYSYSSVEFSGVFDINQSMYVTESLANKVGGDLGPTTLDLTKLLGILFWFFWKRSHELLGILGHNEMGIDFYHDLQGQLWNFSIYK